MRTDNFKFSMEQESLIQSAPNQFLSEIQPPHGWEIVEDTTDSLSEPQDHVEIKKIVSTYLPQIAHNIELFLDRADKQYDIAMPQAFVSIDNDATFHIELLVNQPDLHNPKFIAVKMLAETMLTTTNLISMRYTFVAAGEYFRFHSMKMTSKLKYAYRPAVLLPLTRPAA